jgi:hypothetical protein
MKNNTLLHGVKEERSISHEVKRMTFSWIGHILRNNRLLRHVIEEREKGWEEQEEDVKSCWITVRKREDTGN